MKAVLIFALVPMAIGLHPLLASKFGLYDRHTVLPLAIIVPALLALGWLLKQDATKSLWVLNITAWLLLLFFLWWTRVYSSYAAAETPGGGANIVSGAAGDFKLGDPDGEPFDLPGALASTDATLLVFFRGYW